MNLFKKNKKILVVEDDDDIAEELEARLSLEGYCVLRAENGKTGVEKARTEKPDLIIMDVTMPKLDGHEACKILKADDAFKTIPILFLTARPLMADSEKAFELGASDFLKKPYTNDQLIAKIHKYI